MALSWIGISTTSIVFLSIIIKIFDVNPYSSLAIRIAPLVVMAVMIIVSVIVMIAINRRGTKETSVWIAFIASSILNFTGVLVDVISVYMTPVNDSLGFIANVFYLLAYLGFIVGLAIANYRFKGMKRINPWTPSIVILVTFGLALFFLFRLMNTSGLTQLVQFRYTLFMVLDAALVALAWTLANRTWGGLISVSYFFVAIGCIGLAVYHVVSVFFVIQNVYSLDSVIRILYFVALTLIVIGGDIRISIENRLKDE